MQRQRGFTLVEIAIVLVIIGLLLGGILKGQEMINQAKIKNAIADFSGVSAAYHGYQDRYRRIPGDDNQARTRWTDLSSTPLVDDGDGDGVVRGAYNATTGNTESRNFWLHLRKAGFVSGSGKDAPFNALTGILGVQTGDAAPSPGPGPVLGGASGAGGFSGLIICSANLPDKIAVALDTQMDDGNRINGSVRGQLQDKPNPPIAQNAQDPAVGGTNSYQETGTNTYTVCRAF
jgi:prepilin-type N-terminal cleavage/methylation domain-containing protein